MLDDKHARAAGLVTPPIQGQSLLVFPASGELRPGPRLVSPGALSIHTSSVAAGRAEYNGDLFA